MASPDLGSWVLGPGSWRHDSDAPAKLEPASQGPAGPAGEGRTGTRHSAGADSDSEAIVRTQDARRNRWNHDSRFMIHDSRFSDRDHDHSSEMCSLRA